MRPLRLRHDAEPAPAPGVAVREAVKRDAADEEKRRAVADETEAERRGVADDRAQTAVAPAAAQRERAPLRKGQWTREEESFASAIIREFGRGMLTCPPGTTLRSYLSEKLHCAPTRITKKFVGAASVGKLVFRPCKQTPENVKEAQRVRAELGDMERRFASFLQRAVDVEGVAAQRWTYALLGLEGKLRERSLRTCRRSLTPPAGRGCAVATEERCDARADPRGAGTTLVTSTAE